MDDVISAGETVEKMQTFKEKSVELFGQVALKWQSSDPQSEEEHTSGTRVILTSRRNS